MTIGISTLVMSGLLIVAVLVIAILGTALLTSSREPTSNSAPSRSDMVTEATHPTSLPTLVATLTPIAATETSVPAPTPTPIPDTPTPTPVPPTATPTPRLLAPTATPTAAPRYASVELRGLYDRAIAAEAALLARPARSYSAARADPQCLPLANAASSAFFDLGSAAFNLPYADACQDALSRFGLANLYLNLYIAVRDANPGQWDFGVWQTTPRFEAARTTALAACGY